MGKSFPEKKRQHSSYSPPSKYNLSELPPLTPINELLETHRSSLEITVPLEKRRRFSPQAHGLSLNQRTLTSATQPNQPHRGPPVTSLSPIQSHRDSKPSSDTRSHIAELPQIHAQSGLPLNSQWNQFIQVPSTSSQGKPTALPGKRSFTPSGSSNDVIHLTNLLPPSRENLPYSNLLEDRENLNSVCSLYRNPEKDRENVNLVNLSYVNPLKDRENPNLASSLYSWPGSLNESSFSPPLCRNLGEYNLNTETGYSTNYSQPLSYLHQPLTAGPTLTYPKNYSERIYQLQEPLQIRNSESVIPSSAFCGNPAINTEKYSLVPSQRCVENYSQPTILANQPPPLPLGKIISVPTYSSYRGSVICPAPPPLLSARPTTYDPTSVSRPSYSVHSKFMPCIDLTNDSDPFVYESQNFEGLYKSTPPILRSEDPLTDLSGFKRKQTVTPLNSTLSSGLNDATSVNEILDKPPEKENVVNISASPPKKSPKFSGGNRSNNKILIVPPERNAKRSPIVTNDTSSAGTDSTRSSSEETEAMYPMTMDQSRQEGVPAQHTLQVHMHHLCCPCSNVIYPYYPPGYRPPLLAQPPPIPRPSYLHHYQYTQLHVNPTYNVPLPPPLTQHLPQTMNHSPPSTVDLAFGPPPRDRRNLETQDYEEQRPVSDKNKSDNRDSLLQYASVASDNNYGNVATTQQHENFMDLTSAQVAALSTENYITYLVSGCMTGERIAKRNEHRPCFKNIQNLCNRTRSEVVKPNITVSNIHSQGMPWATKDFIFAFVRAINCWCILRGYLGCKDGNLGKIDREISPEFRSCYTKWEKCTKQLTHYLIETFCRLDEANSPSHISSHSVRDQPNPGPSTSVPTSALPMSKIRNPSPLHETPRKSTQVLSEAVVQNAERNLPNKEMTALKGIPGILHIPPTSSAELGETRNPTSESTEISPRDEDSDSESRVYMKPGSYNVPTKQQSSQSTTNSPRSIEFLDTAQNVAVHHRKVAGEKPESFTSDLLRDKVWQTAQNVTPDFIKQTEEASPTAGNQEPYDVAAQQNKHIESWLNNEKNFFNWVHDGEEESVRASDDPMQISGKFGKASDDLDPARTYRKRGDCDLRTGPKSYSVFRRNFVNTWEYKTGGLTDAALEVLEKIFKEMERTDFAVHINLKLSYTHSDESEIRNPTDLSTIFKKLKSKMYACLNEVVHDFRHIISCSSVYFSDGKIMKQLTVFRDKFDDMISHAFPNIDFGHITGEPSELLGPLVIKQRARLRKSAEGDGDH